MDNDQRTFNKRVHRFVLLMFNQSGGLHKYRECNSRLTPSGLQL